MGLGNSMGFQEVPLLLGVPENRTEALMVCHGLSSCHLFSKKVDACTYNMIIYEADGPSSWGFLKGW